MRDPWGKIFGVIFLIILILLGYFLVLKPKKTIIPVAIPKVATTTHSVIGKSVQGRNIEKYTFGNGTTTIAFAGGMHGGYEWNSVLLAYQFIDHLNTYPEIIPKNISVIIIPDINPDGLFSVIGKEGRLSLADAPPKDDGTGKGRFNANNVDLNRNFDCNWKSESTWRSKKVNAGTSAFSEPESIAIRDFVLKDKPSAFIFWHSQSNAVYASACNNGILPKTLDIMNAYSLASGYPAVSAFNAYPVTGDSEGWLASIRIPAITVEMKTHETVEWDENLAGFLAIMKYFSIKSN